MNSLERFIPWALFVVAIVAALSCGFQDPPVRFVDDGATQTLKLLAGLLFVAMVVERVVEVLVGAPREPETQRLEQQASAAERSLVEARNIHAAAITASAADPQSANASLSKSVVEQAETKAKTADDQVRACKHNTQGQTLFLSFTLGAMLSASGIRVLAQLWTTVPPPPPGTAPDFHGAFNTLDIFITAGLIAGGSKGLHLMLTTFGSYFERAKNPPVPPAG